MRPVPGYAAANWLPFTPPFTLRINRLGAALALEQLFGIFLNGLFPLPHLNRMHPKFLADLVDGLSAPQSLQSHLSFELRRVDFAFLDFGHFLDFLDLRTS